MLTDCNIRINRAQNGYSVSITDPEIVKANDARDRKSDCCAPWRDPNVTYVFATVDKAVEFIKENIEKAFPKDEFSSSFDTEAAKKD